MFYLMYMYLHGMNQALDDVQVHILGVKISHSILFIYLFPFFFFFNLTAKQVFWLDNPA